MADKSGNTNQSDTVWRVRAAIAACTLALVIVGICLFNPINFGQGFTMWAIVSGVWAVGIIMTWIGSRVSDTQDKSQVN